jgi:hypothetical protein
MPGRRPFLRRRHVTAAAAGKAHHQCHRHPAGASSRGAPAEGGVGGRTGSDGAVAGRRPTIRADGIEPVAKSFGACPVRADAATAAAVPSTSAQPVPAAGPDDRSDDRHPETISWPARPQPSLPGSTKRRRELISEPGTHAAELVQHVGVDQESPAAVAAATAKTPLQITCPRRSPGPAAFTAKTPKNGLEITTDLACKR